MRMSVAALLFSAALALAPVAASAQTVEVNPGGVVMHGTDHGHHETVIERHNVVDDDHHGEAEHHEDHHESRHEEHHDERH